MNRTTRHVAGAVGTCLALLIGADRAAAQEPPPDHSHMHMDMDMSSGWHFMQDGVLFGVFNHQGGPRGATEFKAPNWWMGQASHDVGSSRLTLNAMLSLDAATEGKSGYAELFQVGEVLDGRPLVDRQHPHDLFMQLAAVWRVPLGDRWGLTLAGAPVGEPALGPVAFMHRPSAMAQLLGDLWAGGEPNWDTALTDPGVKLHLYGKNEPRAGRKMGHLTALASTPGEALEMVTNARRRLTAAT